MKTNWQIKKLETMKIAWLVQWGFHGQNEDECLRKSGIKRKIIDIISARKDFDKQIIEIAKNIYKQEILSFSEKIYLSNYSKGDKRMKELFGINIPIFTHDQSDLYRNLMKATNEHGLDDSRVKELKDKWSKYPQYIIVGHNPYLKICKVFNLSVYQNDDGNEIIEYDRRLTDGSLKREKHEEKN